jgi:hypothetical protein
MVLNTPIDKGVIMTQVAVSQNDHHFILMPDVGCPFVPTSISISANETELPLHTLRTAPSASTYLDGLITTALQLSHSLLIPVTLSPRYPLPYSSSSSSSSSSYSSSSSPNNTTISLRLSMKGTLILPKGLSFTKWEKNKRFYVYFPLVSTSSSSRSNSRINNPWVMDQPDATEFLWECNVTSKQQGLVTFDRTIVFTSEQVALFVKTVLSRRANREEDNPWPNEMAMENRLSMLENFRQDMLLETKNRQAERQSALVTETLEHYENKDEDDMDEEYSSSGMPIRKGSMRSRVSSAKKHGKDSNSSSATFTDEQVARQWQEEEFEEYGPERRQKTSRKKQQPYQKQ